jgi:pseudaminic acid synthase
MSGNHNKSLDRAMQIVEAAAQAGADALKLQTYTPDTMTLDLAEGEFFIDDPTSLWYGNSLYELYEKAYTPWEWHKLIFDRCKELGMIGFSTAYEPTAVDFLEELDVPAYKIASSENTYLHLIKRAAQTGKPLLISTGMATVAELDETVRTARDAGCKEIVLLKCTSSYPAKADKANLLTMPHMQELFSVPVGISDHTLSIGVAIAAVALGASVIEKHLTLNRSDGGVDDAFSMEPGEFKTLVEQSQQAWQALGKVHYGPTKEEAVKGRRSLYIVEDMKKGDAFNSKNLRAIRPGCGLPSKYYDIVIDKRVNRDVKKGTPLTWDLIG